MAVVVVTNMQEANAALDRGDAYILRSKTLTKIMGYQGNRIGALNQFKTSSSISVGTLGSTSSSVSGGLGNTLADSSTSYQQYSQNYAQRATPLNQQLTGYTNVNPYS